MSIRAVRPAHLPLPNVTIPSKVPAYQWVRDATGSSVTMGCTSNFSRNSTYPLDVVGVVVGHFDGLTVDDFLTERVDLGPAYRSLVTCLPRNLFQCSDCRSLTHCA